MLVLIVNNDKIECWNNELYYIAVKNNYFHYFVECIILSLHFISNTMTQFISYFSNVTK